MMCSCVIKFTLLTGRRTTLTLFHLEDGHGGHEVAGFFLGVDRAGDHSHDGSLSCGCSARNRSGAIWVDAVIAQGSYTSFHGVKVRPLHVHSTLLLRSRRSTKCGEYKRCLSRARTWSRNLRWARYRDGRTYGIALAADAFTGDCWPVELFKVRPIFDQRRAAFAGAAGIKCQGRQNSVTHIAWYPWLIGEVSDLRLGLCGRTDEIVRSEEHTTDIQSLGTLVC